VDPFVSPIITSSIIYNTGHNYNELPFTLSRKMVEGRWLREIVEAVEKQMKRSDHGRIKRI